MPQITFNQAKKFLNNIIHKDKVAIIHHDDLDGFASGILFYNWCEKQGTRPRQFAYSINKSSLKDYPLKKFNKIIITDIAPDLIGEEFESIKDKKVLYSDHHPITQPIPEEILELRTINKGYIPSSRTAQELTQLKPWLGLAGTIGDMAYLYEENDTYINNILKTEKISLEEFKEKVSSVITNTLIYFDKKTEKVFEILKNINSIKEVNQLKIYSEPIEDEIQKYVEEYESKKEKLGNINFYYLNPKLSIKSIVSAILSRKYPEEIFILASPKNINTIVLSGRNENKKSTAKKILEAGTNGLKNSRFGGHERGAGGIIQTKDLEKFKQNIRDYQN